MKDHQGHDLYVGDRVIPVGWGDGVTLTLSNTPATVVGFGRTRVRVQFDGWAYGGRFAEFDAVGPYMLRRLEPADSKCWRHDYRHREYVCTCDPPVEGDTGREPTDSEVER